MVKESKASKRMSTSVSGIQKALGGWKRAEGTGGTALGAAARNSRRMPEEEPFGRFLQKRLLEGLSQSFPQNFTQEQ